MKLIVSTFLVYKALKFRKWFKYGLKAQKLLAQGIALGIIAISKAPCKGKSFVNCLVLESFCPFRASNLRPWLPRALPWARSFCPFRACGAHLRNLSKVKKCLLKSGKVIYWNQEKSPFGWSAYARYTGIRSPPSGHRQPLCWATTAHNAGNECPNIGLIFGQYSFDSLRYLKCIFAMFKMTFSDV